MVFFLFLPNFIFGQDKNCGTESPKNFLTHSLSPTNFRQENDTQTFTIPIIVHVLHIGEKIGEGTNISAAQIYSQFDVLNEDFNLKNLDKDNILPIFKDRAESANIRFVPAKIDKNGFFLEEIGINRVKIEKNTLSATDINTNYLPNILWNPKKYLNIVIVEKIVEQSKNLIGYNVHFPDSSRLAGLAEQNKDAEIDAIVIAHNRFGSYQKFKAKQLEGITNNAGRTATHEIGHYLGLLHTFESYNCNSNNDFCEDTPKNITENNGCNLQRQNCGNLVMIQNFMDYTDDKCMALFTKDQVARMRQVLKNSPQRKELNDSPVLGPENEDITEKIIIYPNPTTDFVQLASISKNTFLDYEIYNYLGQKIANGTIENQQIDMRPFAKGVYLLKIRTEKNQFFTQKILKIE